MYYVYIIESVTDKSYYIGQTKDLAERVKRHNLGHSKSTKAKIPWNLVYSKSFNNRGQAVEYEKKLKRQKNKDYLHWLIEKSNEEKRGVAQLV